MKKSNHKTRIKRFAAIMAFLGVALALVWVYARSQDLCKATRVVGGKANVKALYHFDDVNDTQITAAQQFGIEPLQSRDELDSVLLTSLVKVETCNGFCVEPLTHSVPYLTPNANELLHTIATKFQDKLQDKGFAQYQVVVTSLLRTSDDVRRLRRVNGNAVSKSCHMYGTTFDIAYNCFQQVDSLADFEGDLASHKELVNILGETLKELRDDNLCYVKYERRQPCFHITARY